MKLALPVSPVSLLFADSLIAAEPALALRRQKADVVLHCGDVPARMVLGHPDKHPEAPGLARSRLLVVSREHATATNALLCPASPVRRAASNILERKLS